MENEKVCPICKGEGFLKSRRTTISDIEYLFYVRCDCMKKKAKTEHNNPFKEGETESHGTKNTAL